MNVFSRRNQLALFMAGMMCSVTLGVKPGCPALETINLRSPRTPLFAVNKANGRVSIKYPDDGDDSASCEESRRLIKSAAWLTKQDVAILTGPTNKFGIENRKVIDNWKPNPNKSTKRKHKTRYINTQPRDFEKENAERIAKKKVVKEAERQAAEAKRQADLAKKQEELDAKLRAEAKRKQEESLERFRELKREEENRIMREVAGVFKSRAARRQKRRREQGKRFEGSFEIVESLDRTTPGLEAARTASRAKLARRSSTVGRTPPGPDAAQNKTQSTTARGKKGSIPQFKKGQAVEVYSNRKMQWVWGQIDEVLKKSKNSLYSIKVQENGEYAFKKIRERDTYGADRIRKRQTDPSRKYSNSYGRKRI